MLRNRMNRSSLGGSQFDATRLRLDTGEGRNGLIDLDGGYLRTSYNVRVHEVEDVHLFNSGRHLAVITRTGGDTGTGGGVWVFKLGEPYNFLNYELVGFMSGSLSENNPTSVWMSDDGTKMAWTGRSSDRVRIGTCTTPYDPSTVSSINASGSLNNSSGSVEAAPRALEVHPSGTKFWIWGRTTDSVLEFNMSTAWVPPSTATNANVTHSTATQTTNVESIRWADGGTKLYITNNSGYVWRYNAGSAYSISSLTNQTSTNTTRILANGNTHQGAHFNNQLSSNFEVASGSAYVTRIASVSADTMYVAICDQQNRNHFPLEMISMEMTTDWDEETLQVNPTAMRGLWRAGQVSGAEFQGFDFMEQGRTENSVYKDGGERLYTLSDGGTIKQFHLNAPFGLEGYGGTPFQSQDISSIVGTNLRDLWVRPNGQDFYILTPTHIRKLRASTPTDVTTLSLNESLTHGFTSIADPCFLWISPDGTKLAVAGSTNAPNTGYTGDLRVWTLSTGFNLNSASLTYSVSMGAGGDPCAMAWSPDGTRLIWASNNDTQDRIIVDEYELSTAWNAATKGSAREASKIQLTRFANNGSLMRWNTAALGGYNAGRGGRSLIVSGGEKNGCLYTMTTY